MVLWILLVIFFCFKFEIDFRNIFCVGEFLLLVRNIVFVLEIYIYIILFLFFIGKWVEWERNRDGVEIKGIEFKGNGVEGYDIG